MFVNDLNKFYTRFDHHDFHQQRELIQATLNSTAPDPITISEDEVRQVLRRINPSKAAGPDCLTGRVLKLCGNELSSPVSRLFQSTMNMFKIPLTWKKAKIVPLPKKPQPTVMNDYRPVALTPILMKCLERIVLSKLLPQVKSQIDPLQFAYQAKRGVEDATLTLVHNLQQHLDGVGNSTRVLFVDFSSAFNTMQPHLLINKLRSLNVNSGLTLWIHDFLTKRQQQVCIGDTWSKTLVTNTGAPQGCVLSPVLFTLYTNDCRSTSNRCDVIKYADDTAILGRLNKTPESVNRYRECIQNFVVWCADNFLELNVTKTQEMVFDFSKSPSAVAPVNINGADVEVTAEYKYLGTVIDHKLSWSPNINRIYSKCQQRLYFLRKLRQFNVDRTLINLFYKSVIESVICFCVVVYYGNSRVIDNNKVAKITKQASRIIGSPCKSPEELFESCSRRMVTSIMSDSTHPLHHNYTMLRSGRRLMSLKCRTTRFLSSFVPRSIRYFNDQYK